MKRGQFNRQYKPSTTAKFVSIFKFYQILSQIIKSNLTYLPTPRCRVFPEQLTFFAASQEISRISRNPKVHYRTHNIPPPVSILSQPNPVHIPTSHLLQIHPNINHPSTPRSPQWSLSLQFPTKTLYPPPPRPHYLLNNAITILSSSLLGLVSLVLALYIVLQFIVMYRFDKF